MGARGPCGMGHRDLSVRIVRVLAVGGRAPVSQVAADEARIRLRQGRNLSKSRNHELEGRKFVVTLRDVLQDEWAGRRLAQILNPLGRYYGFDCVAYRE